MLLPALTAALPWQPPEPFQPAYLHILTPGPNSIVTSPILLIADLHCGESGLARIELVDLHGKLLSRQVLRLSSRLGMPSHVTLPIYFDIPHNEVNARLTIYVNDQFGRPLSLTSVNLTLTSKDSAINPPRDGQSAFVISTPQAGSTHTGDTLQIKGWMHPYNSSAVIFELITETGGIIGSRQLAVPENSYEAFIPFEVELPYIFVTSTRNVRLVIRQMGENIPGNVVLVSQQLWIAP
ncbi:MAG: hypothetical protein ABIG43_06345 [Chloroflexota bacterium]